MRQQGSGARAVVIAALAALLVVVPLSAVRAQTPPDKSDVVLALDFSASILDDPANRNRFGAALERIADRVEETSAELVAGDTTVSILQFAGRAADYRGCTGLRLLGSPAAVAQFAKCLRAVASQYRKGLQPGLTRKIGVDTNYVAAMEQAAKLLPPDAVRPTLIMFTDGEHDVRGVPASQVPVARDRLFGDRSPFALLPVGMGLDPTKRDALERGLLGLRIVRNMPPCISGSTFDWPQVVFGSPDSAGNAVAVALQNATCTFTAVEATPTPVPTPVPTPGPVQDIQLTARDGAIDLTWAPPSNSAVPVVDYRARCRADSGDSIESKEGVSLDTTTTVDGLTNGVAYRCEVAAVGSVTEGAWTDAGTVVTPMGRPAPPGKPAVQALDSALTISVIADDVAGLSGYRYECSGDSGTTWPAEAETGSVDTTAQIGNLTNGVQYICRAYAVNPIGLSEASVVSDAVMPCGSLIECNPLLRPILGALGLVLAVVLLAMFVALYRERRRGYVVAVLDVVHTANLGHGSRLGITYVRDADTKRVTGIVAARGSNADLRIRKLRGDRFDVTDRVGRHRAADGEPITVLDPGSGRHALVLRAFATKAASQVSTRG